ncbi:hypothetical protein [Sphingomonas sp. PB2P19]|uniref:hypothetical protein n=1 Tax=Sphingomonas rhamnosi TaxID=3096156 RepID=UPI002FC89B5F
MTISIDVSVAMTRGTVAPGNMREITQPSGNDPGAPAMSSQRHRKGLGRDQSNTEWLLMFGYAAVTTLWKYGVGDAQAIRTLCRIGPDRR